MPNHREILLRALDDVPAIALAEAGRADRALACASACIAGGFRVVTVALTLPEAPDVIASLAARPDLLVGGSRAIDPVAARRAVSAGATFLFSPAVVPEVGAIAREAAVPWFAGAATPGEVQAARNAGTDLVHLFPAGTLAGPAYLRHLKSAFPDVSFACGGGIAGDRLGAWLQAGAICVVLQEAIYSADLLATGDAMTIRHHAAAVHAEASRYSRRTRGGPA